MAIIILAGIAATKIAKNIFESLEEVFSSSK